MTRSVPPLRYLDASAVRRALPPPAALLELAERAVCALVTGDSASGRATLSVGDGSVFALALTAHVPASDLGGGDASAVLGLKWLAGASGNREAGLPTLAALIVLNASQTGVPIAILEGAVITAARTAALSGVAVRLLGPGRRRGPARALLIGAGVQGRAHAEMLGFVRPGISLFIHDRHPERAEDLAEGARTMDGVARAEPVADLADTLQTVDLIVTATSLRGNQPAIRPADVAAQVLVLPVDYGACVTSDLVEAARAFVVDDRRQFEGNRASGRLPGWPDPTATLGELLLHPRPRPTGIVVALHQGPGIADVMVADAVLRRAVSEGLGIELPR